MTSHKRVRRIQRSDRRPLFPLCGEGKGSLQHNWTPGSIAIHVDVCPKCQRLENIALARSPSERRERAAQASALDAQRDEAPFPLV